MTTASALEPVAATPSLVAPVRILHALGHLSRGGIETWLYQTIRRMNPVRFEHHVLLLTDQEEPFTAAFRDAGIHLHVCPGMRRPQRFLAGLHRVLRTAGPFDVLHAHGFSALTTAALTLGKAAGIPIRLLHGHNDLRPRMARAGIFYRAYAQASLAVQRAGATHGAACSRPAAEWTFGKRNPDAELLIGTDLAACMLPPDATMRAKLGIPPDRFVIAQVARFTVAKNHAFTLELAPALAARSVPFHLLLIGDGPLRKTVLEDLHVAGLSERLTWLGNCDHVPAMLTSVVDLCLLPSLNEGLGLAAIEAQAAAIPVLVADTVPRECAIEPALIDFLPIDRGPQPWVERVEHRLSQQRAELTAAHRQKILSSRFHIDRSVDRLSALYAGVSL